MLRSAQHDRDGNGITQRQGRFAQFLRPLPLRQAAVFSQVFPIPARFTFRRLARFFDDYDAYAKDGTWRDLPACAGHRKLKLAYGGPASARECPKAEPK